MSGPSSIEWTGSTWSPNRGCSRVSPGCEHCYAEKIASRFSGPGLAFEGFAENGKWTRKVSLMDDQLDTPLHWKTPRIIFVNSMSDTFHDALSNEDIARAFAVMAACPHHTFQVLTKRVERAADVSAWLGAKDAERLRAAGEDLAGRMGWCHANEHAWTWPLPNVHLGVSVEDQKRADERIPVLLRTPAAIRFLSVEPLLEEVDLNRAAWAEGWPRPSIEVQARQVTPPGETSWDSGFTPLRALDWVIVGGESGPSARPCHLAWIRSIVAQCKVAKVPVFVKQLGAHVIDSPSASAEPFAVKLKDRKGGDMAEWPEDLRVREMPTNPGATT